MPPDTSDRHGHSHAAPVGPPLLRGRGRRLTRQRKLIWEALAAEGDGHLSAEDVVARVRAQLAAVNPSTIYRTLELLVEEKMVLRTDPWREPCLLSSWRASTDTITSSADAAEQSPTSTTTCSETWEAGSKRPRATRWAPGS